MIFDQCNLLVFVCLYLKAHNITVTTSIPVAITSITDTGIATAPAKGNSAVVVGIGVELVKAKFSVEITLLVEHSVTGELTHVGWLCVDVV